MREARMGWMAALLDISLATANRLYTWGWGLSVSGAVVTMIGVGMLWLGTRVRDRDFDENIAALHENAAKFEKEAAVARLETEKLKAVVAWRTLSAEQNDAMEKVLAQKPGTVKLLWTDGDPESFFFAI